MLIYYQKATFKCFFTMSDLILLTLVLSSIYFLGNIGHFFLDLQLLFPPSMKN